MVPAVIIFLAAWLLFQVQPLLGKMILPWFGGGASVWTVCMLFFQSMLLVGYAYSHWVTRLCSGRGQVGIHLVLLVTSLVFLPIVPTEAFRPMAGEDPTSGVLLLMLATVGLPFILLAASSPLIQYWSVESSADRSVYRLYALSNLGSLLGLLTYPFLLEPLLGLTRQSLAWSAAYVLFAVFTVLFGWQVYRRGGIAPKVAGAEQATGQTPRLLWLLLPMSASLLLLATTNQLTQDLAPMPLLWVLPLTLYLLSFVISFHSERWYDRRLWVPVFMVSAVAALWLLYEGVFIDLRIQLGVLSLVLFSACIVCHGELFRLRPGADRLTGFYLCMATGGALGGVLVAIVAPLVFNGLWEFQLGLVLTSLLLLIAMIRADRAGGKTAIIVVALGTILLFVSLTMSITGQGISVIAKSRNFYGVVTAVESARNLDKWRRDLWHGSVRHGIQYMSPENHEVPTLYYGPAGGGGLTMRFRPGDSLNTGLKAGAIGLGIGTLATYLTPRDQIRFYEIDPQIVDYARNYFTYLKQSRGKVEVVLGDARLSMERELEQGEGQQYDVLLIDAFNSDSIPVHLLTREAFELYWQHLKPNGILAVHTTAVHTGLEPLIRDIAHAMGKEAVLIADSGKEWYASSTAWVVVTNNQRFLQHAAIEPHSVMPRVEGGSRRVWTDDYSNLIPYLKW